MSGIGQITSTVKKAAQEAGFDLVGVAPVADSPELAYFPQWIEAGYAGQMNYLQARDDQGRLRRASLHQSIPWAHSVVVCAINYNTAQPYSTDVNNKRRGWISRYAWGREDYHQAVVRRLRRVELALHRAAGEARDRVDVQADDVGGQLNASRDRVEDSKNDSAAGDSALQTRCYVDTGPIVERVFAKYAGIGWMGKNTCIINQKIGSWLFLGVILTSLELDADLPAPDRCGSCTRCIDACPTDALIAPYQLDSKKCISYLTIEKRGPLPEELLPGIGHQVFGCDICQDVCPWNRRAAATSADEFQPRAELVNPALDWLAEMDQEEFRRVFKGSPIRRTKRSGLRRNAVIAMGNSKNREFLPLLEKLAKDQDPIVAKSANSALRTLQHSDR